MSIHRIGVWGGQGGQRNVYRYEKKDRDRMGNCSWLPRRGDLCVRVADAGDHFHEYVVIRKNERGLWAKYRKFSAYEFGELLFQFKEHTFYLLLAGEAIQLPAGVRKFCE